ncbi:MAG: 4-(cytidine 5'-diphospho)-2-C-methyl-D-erythritol kinase [Candidatus Marinimicrobia bacterium]|nr:4-(cytidine 5'-diphospho)-2-C-methyl-D-erythritol kinase [Candidatus Neomarinimicrobiota bacterium]|tara:strand:+ start:1434 stop:2267 length:834 start_codon:yes stop_codon:yes gene_type:complete
MSISLVSNAKLNLALSINYKRSDGYHDISSIMQEIDLHDTIEISKNNSKKIHIISKGIPVPEDSTNLCHIAADIFFSEYNIQERVNIIINKKIPVGGGLGGGSSNASTILKGLSQLFNINPKQELLHAISTKIGADVAFFNNGGLQYAQGIGDKLTPLPNLMHGFHFLIICPQISISTPWAYSTYKKYLENKLNESNFVPLSDKLDFSLWNNDFEKVVLSTYPEINEIKHMLKRTNTLFASLSGSGSTMFGVYDSLESVTIARNQFKDFQTYIALPI